MDEQQPDLSFRAFNPSCLVVAGTLSDEITDLVKGKSFELFAKIKILMDLFGSTPYEQ